MHRTAVKSDRSGRSADDLSNIGNWKRTLDRLVYFVRLSGVPPALIQREFAASIQRYRSIQQARVPPTHQLAYPRVLARWKDDRTFLDGRGRPRALRFDGPEPNFKTLVEGALPNADPADVLASFKRHRIVSQDPNGAITVLRDMFVPAGPRLGWDIYIVLVSLQGLAETCYENIRGRARGRIPLVHRFAYTEKFDPRYLRQYDRFFRKSAGSFLELHHDWLRRHERTEPLRKSRRPRTSRLRSEFNTVGVGLYGMAGF
jgi:hypothetical protein